MKYKKILIIQTAFLGDVILALPLMQVLKEKFPDSFIDFLCIPQTSELLKNNPYVNEVIVYDKRKSGIKGFFAITKKLKQKKYDLIISPHRSFRTSLISFLAGAANTISFNKSSFSFLYDYKIKYIQYFHEIRRNLTLLEPLGIFENKIIRPELFPGENEKKKIDLFFTENNIRVEDKVISIAPGSVWFTKRFPEDKFVTLCDYLNETGHKIILIGGKDDMNICAYIKNHSVNKNIIDASGKFSILESAEIIARSSLVVSNDSAPLHLANSLNTDVVAIYGSTVYSFGFYPYGRNDVVIETIGLKCRPCTDHGNNKCPISSFICMKNIEEKGISEKIKKLLS